jgi:hypothetical protein
MRMHEEGNRHDPGIEITGGVFRQPADAPEFTHTVFILQAEGSPEV